MQSISTPEHSSPGIASTSLNGGHPSSGITPTPRSHPTSCIHTGTPSPGDQLSSCIHPFPTTGPTTASALASGVHRSSQNHATPSLQPHSSLEIQPSTLCACSHQEVAAEGSDVAGESSFRYRVEAPERDEKVNAGNWNWGGYEYSRDVRASSCGVRILFWFLVSSCILFFSQVVAFVEKGFSEQMVSNCQGIWNSYVAPSVSLHLTSAHIFLLLYFLQS